MSDRQRNLFVLLLVAGLLIASAVVISSKETKLGLDLQGGVELVYEVKPRAGQPPPTPDAIQRAIDVMRERVDKLGVAEPEIQQSGDNQINVALPDVSDLAEAIKQVGTVAQLAFYDWEVNVIGPEGKPDPTNPAVTGGPGGGDAAQPRSAVALRRTAARQAAPGQGRGRTTRATAASTTPSIDEDQEGLRPRRGVARRRAGERRPAAQRASRPRSSRSSPTRSSCAPRTRRRREGRQVVRAQGRRRARGQGAQGARAGLRPGRRRLGQPDRHVQVHRQGPQDVGGGHQADRRARPGERRRPAGNHDRPRRSPSTSRSCSTTSSSRRRSSTSSRTPRASTRATARRSRAASRSRPPRSSRTS